MEIEPRCRARPRTAAPRSRSSNRRRRRSWRAVRARVRDPDPADAGRAGSRACPHAPRIAGPRQGRRSHARARHPIHAVAPASPTGASRACQRVPSRGIRWLARSRTEDAHGAGTVARPARGERRQRRRHARGAERLEVIPLDIRDADVALSPTGVEQAEALGDWLQPRLPRARHAVELAVRARAPDARRSRSASSVAIAWCSPTSGSATASWACSTC